MQGLQAFAETYLVPLQLVFAMLGMGATLSLKDFGAIAKRPKALMLGLALQWIYVPVVAYAMGLGFKLDAGWAVGLILVAAVPGGATSNLLTFLGKGNVALSIAVTTASTLLCVATVPMVLSIFASEHLPATFEFPTLRIFRDIGLFLLAPLAIGMGIFRWNEEHAARVSKWSIRLSVASIVVIATAALGSGRIEPLSYGLFSPGLIVVFGLVLTLSVPQIVRALGFDDLDTLALSIEVIVRNIAIGLLLVQFFFPGEDAQGHVLFTCLFYSGLSLPCVLPMLYRGRKGSSPALFRAPKRPA